MIRKTYPKFFLLLKTVIVPFVFLSTVQNCEGQTGEIQGQTQNIKEKPIPSAHVFIVNKNGNRIIIEASS